MIYLLLIIKTLSIDFNNYFYCKNLDKIGSKFYGLISLLLLLKNVKS
jgi:hypothetical protein